MKRGIGEHVAGAEARCPKLRDGGLLECGIAAGVPYRPYAVVWSLRLLAITRVHHMARCVGVNGVPHFLS